MLARLLLLFALLAAAALPAADEARFDPPLGGVFLGVGVDVREGRAAIRFVEPGSAAERGGLQPGDEIVDLAGKGGFASFEEFAGAVQTLKRGEPAAVQVLRRDQMHTLSVLPDPAILQDHYRLLSYLRDSRFLRGRQGYGEAIAAIESGVPDALRRASRTSEAYEILNRALGKLGTSHTAVIPPWAYRNLFTGEADGKEGYSTGLVLERTEVAGGSAYFVADVLDAGPAVKAGVLRGDEIVAVNGVPAASTPRLTLAGYEADRPHSTLQVERGETISLTLRRSPDLPLQSLELTADTPLNGMRASAASYRLIDREGRRIAYFHLWNLLSPRAPGLVSEALARDARHAEAIVVDLRGRGGQVGVMTNVMKLLSAARRPVALLIDRETRSAKEILAQQLKGLPGVVLVGERTAGAVLPGGYRELSGGAAVILPQDPSGIEKLTGGKPLEGRGVEPDVAVARPGIYSKGADPILEAGLEAVLKRLRDVPVTRRI